MNGSGRNRKVPGTIALRHFFVLSITLLFLSPPSCRSPAGEGGKEILTVAGSTSVQPFAEKLAEEYLARHPEVNINVQGGGSSAGVRATQTGVAQVGMSSRNLKPSEKGLHEIVIAYDGIAMIVHRSNPLKGLSREQIKKIFTGEFTRWENIGGVGGEIHFVTREEGSGTRGAFEEMVMEKENISHRALVQASNGAVREIVANDPGSLGYISLGLVDRRVKALAVDRVSASRSEILAKRYVIVRPFLFLSREELQGLARDFVEFVLSPEGQELLAAEGLMPGQG